MIIIGGHDELNRLQAQLRQLGKDPRRTLVSASNRTARRVKTRVSSAVREEVPVQKKLVDSKISIKKAYFGKGRIDTQAEVTLRPYAALLYKQQGRPRGPENQKGKAVGRRRKGASAVYLKSKGRETFRGTFVARMTSGHVGIFERVKGEYTSRLVRRNGRLTRVRVEKIRELWGSRFADAITDQREREIERESVAFFEQNVAGLTQRAIDRAAR